MQDQIAEIQNKWNQLDDEIWGKIICFERNRRIAKAYARSHVISVCGSEIGFDGYRIGLNGFTNYCRDGEVEMVKKQIKTVRSTLFFNSIYIDPIVVIGVQEQ